MLVPRAAYDSISQDFLLGSQQILANLLARCDERVRLEGHGRQHSEGASRHGNYLRKQQVGAEQRLSTI